MKRVSLVILTYNRPNELAWTVQRSLALPEQPPIVVVDNGSAQPPALDLHPRVKVVRLPTNIGAAGRNVGVQHVATPYVAFSDDDTCWERGSLADAVAILDAYPTVAALTARVLIGASEREDPVCAELAASPLPWRGLPGPSLLGFLAGATVFRRAAFLDAGGYEPRLFLGGEEKLLAYDLAARGWSVCYADKLTVHHYPSPTRDSETRRRLLVRNAIWVAWLRRPVMAAVRETIRYAGEPGFGDAFAGAVWVLRRRRIMPPRVAELCERLETSTAHHGEPIRHRHDALSDPARCPATPQDRRAARDASTRALQVPQNEYPLPDPPASRVRVAPSSPRAPTRAVR